MSTVIRGLTIGVLVSLWLRLAIVPCAGLALWVLLVHTKISYCSVEIHRRVVSLSLFV